MLKMAPIKVIIIDDEHLARKRLANLIDEVSEFKLLSQCSNGEQAIKEIEDLKPDLIFLDIEMKDMTGFDVLEKLTMEILPTIIFVTAYDNYAIKAFDSFAFDYLLKPFKDQRFFESVSKVIEQIRLKKRQSSDNLIQLLATIEQRENKLKDTHALQSIPIKLGNKISFLKIKDIKYITASGYYAEIYSEEKKHLIRRSLANLILEINNDNFIRIHRSTIINLEYMYEIINSSFGEMDVKMKDGKLFRISKSYKKDFSKKLNI
ncbi:DNA-binding response regulator [Winogradskyella haliclonae]|uniref:DNA-binding response regulator n=2 Tax=Winogradskyella haliclonae TaxID=2048558 RepID=A0ABQ2BZE3_9FLAO|nr:DNA-binding response regulator [Winogradskyella haliclonae]